MTSSAGKLSVLKALLQLQSICRGPVGLPSPLDPLLFFNTHYEKSVVTMSDQLVGAQPGAFEGAHLHTVVQSTCACLK